jgi:hypothetical protein
MVSFPEGLVTEITGFRSIIGCVFMAVYLFVVLADYDTCRETPIVWSMRGYDTP